MVEVEIMKDIVSSYYIASDQAECLGMLEGGENFQGLASEDILRAMENPVWRNDDGPPVFDLIQPGEKVCIVISDHTRKTAVDNLLPPFLDCLIQKRRCNIDDMFIIVASGIHRHPTDDEIAHITGRSIFNTFKGRVYCHDPDDERNLVSVGRTRSGHEVRINRMAVESDRLVLFGTVMFHYHAGFGGGRKSLVPGLAARSTIAHTHSLSLDPSRDDIHPSVAPGVLTGNPVAEEILEAAALHPPDFIINSVLAADGSLVGVFAGDMESAHLAACCLVERASGVNIQKPADFVIASAGNASNWIQSHKALFNAHRAVHSDGRVILFAPCKEGIGDERFRYWITRASIKEVCAGLRKNPEVLGQTALSTKIRGTSTILVTEMNRRDSDDLGMTTATDLESAIRITLDHFRARGVKRPSFYLMPNAGALLPTFGN